MIIEQTNIPDVTKENIDRSKVVLADNIITNVYPLFDDVYKSHIASNARIKSEYKRNKNKLKENKNRLEQLMVELKRAKKEAKLLDRIEKLITSGLAYDGGMKHETVILLKVIHKLNDEKLDYHLRNTLNMISKRFAK